MLPTLRPRALPLHGRRRAARIEASDASRQAKLYTEETQPGYGLLMAYGMPPLNWLRAFEASARHMSFAQAARDLNLTSTAVSHQVRSLSRAASGPSRCSSGWRAACV